MANTSSNKQIKLGAIISYIAIAFNIISGLIYTPWMVEQIGRADYGLYTLVTSVISYFTLDFGFGGAISKFIAQYRAEKKEEEIGKLLGLIYKFYLAIDVFILIALTVVFFFIENIFVSLTPLEIEKFKTIFVISGMFTLVSFPCTTFNGILIAHEKFIQMKICDLLTKVLIVVFMVISLFMGYGLYALVLVNTFVHLLINLIKFMIVKNSLNSKIDFRFFDKKMLKTVTSFSIWITVISIAQRFLFNITPSILGITSGTIAISIFAVGSTIEGYTWTFANALNSLFLPKVSRMVADNASREEVTDLMIRVGRIQLIIVGAILSIFIAMGQEFVVLWMGEGFRASYPVAVLIILPCIITLTLDIARTLLMVENKVRYRAIWYTVAAIVSVIISFILSPKLGALGAAIGIFMASLTGHIFGMNWVYSKKLNLNMTRFYKSCHLKALPIFIVTIILGIIIQKLFPLNSLLMFIIKAGVLGVIYLLQMWFFYMNKGEKSLITDTLKKLLRK